jgi:hypothetical protein
MTTGVRRSAPQTTHTAAPTRTAQATKPAATPPKPPAAKKADDFEPSTGKGAALPPPASTPAADPALAADAARLRSQANAGVQAPLPKGFKIERGAGGVTITATSGNDKISVEPRKDGKPGVDVVSGKGRVSLSDDEAKRLTIDGGAGNDTIVVDPRVTYDLTLKGGAGDDLIRGGGGNDRIDGGDDRDFLYGNGGNDTITGGKGDDTISGGAGDDVMSGGTGKNTVVGGTGKNTFANAGGTDRDFHNKGDGFGNVKGATNTKAPTKVETGDVSGAKAPGHSIQIDGTPEFKAKVEAELEILRSTPSGRAMLEDIDKQNAAGRPIRIKEGSENVHADGLNTAKPDVEADALPKGVKVKNTVGTGKGTGSVVEFSPDVHRTDDMLDQSTQPADADDARTVAPSIALFHELVHAHRNQLAESEGLTKGEEFAAAGTRAHDSADKKAEWKYNENQFRRELGAPERYSYD